MKQIYSIFTFLLLLACSAITQAQTDKVGSTVLAAHPTSTVPQEHADKGAGALDAQREKRALKIFLKSVQTEIVAAAEDMPAVKYSFAPTEGEYKGVRTFGQQVRMNASARGGTECPTLR